MSAKTFLIAHGEKLAVVAVAGGCALVLWSSIDDPTIRPKDNQQQIEAINAKIDTVFKKQSPPVMKEPRPYLDQLLARIGESAPVTPTMAWLTNPPDKGRGPVKLPNGETGGQITAPTGTFLYIYELLTPTVGITDAIGSLRVTVAPPAVAASGGQGRRISSDADRRWTREDKGQVVNTARHLGVQVQIRIGDNEWKPLVLPGASKDGVLPFVGSSGKEGAASTGPSVAVTIPTPEPWQRHKLRARLIAAATALDLEAKNVERPKLTVLVHPGAASPGPTDDAAVLDKATAQVLAKDGALFNTLLRPEAGPLPPGAKLKDGEKLFLGPWSPDSDASQVDATASVRFALIGLSTAPTAEDPSKSRDVGRFLLLRLFQQQKGDERKWMEKPLEERFGVGDVLGLPKVKIPNPFGGGMIETDLLTPFVIDKLTKDQKRILYWTVQPKARQGGGKDRDLILDKKEVNTDIVVLKNPDTGSELVLTKLISIVPPVKADTLIYPHRAAAYVEKDEFTKAPSEFRQWGLIPEEPKAFQPGTGPLDELHKKQLAEGALDAASFRTDSPYYVFPDGRIAWWELVEHKLKVHDPENVMTAKAPTAAATATPPTGSEPQAPVTAPAHPAPKTGPQANPPTVPPGTTPPGTMPPIPPKK